MTTDKPEESFETFEERIELTKSMIESLVDHAGDPPRPTPTEMQRLVRIESALYTVMKNQIKIMRAMRAKL